MKTIFSGTTAVIAALLLSGAAFADEPATKTMDGVLVNHAGMTLYTFDKDVAGSGKSACNGPCAKLWLSVAAPERTMAPYSVVSRDDGSKQLAYNGKPLYLYSADVEAGQRNGDNFKQIWHVVKP